MEEFLYGKLNKEVEQVLYKGADTDTAKVNVDNNNSTISVDVHKYSSPVANMVVGYSSDGTIASNNPINDLDVTNKAYINSRLPFGIDVLSEEVYAPEQTISIESETTLDFGDGQTYTVFCADQSEIDMIDEIKGGGQFLLNKYYRATVDGVEYYLYCYIHTRVLTQGIQDYESDPSSITVYTDIGMKGWDEAYVIGNSNFIGIDNSNNEDGIPFLFGVSRWSDNVTDLKSCKLIFGTAGSHTFKLERLVIREQSISVPILSHQNRDGHPVAQKSTGGIIIGYEAGSNNSGTSTIIDRGVIKVDSTTYGRNLNRGYYLMGKSGNNITLGDFGFIKDARYSNSVGYGNKIINSNGSDVIGTRNLIEGYSYDGFARCEMLGFQNSYKTERDTSKMLPSIMIGGQNSDTLAQNVQIGYQNSITSSAGCFNIGLSNTVSANANLSMNIGFGNTGTARTMRLGYYTDSSNTTDKYQFGDGDTTTGHNMFSIGNDGTDYRITLNDTTITEPELITIKNLPSVVGDINTVLDSVNGVVI